MVQKFETKEIATLHADIWFKDDERNYDKLQESVKKLLEIRGHTTSSKILSELIRECYEIYGNLDDKKIILSPSYVFNKFIFSRFKKIYTLTGEKNPELQAKYHSKWWKVFYEKKQNKPIWTTKLISNILKLHLAKFGKIHICDAGLCTKYLIQAGYAQHLRNLPLTIDNLLKYWEVINRISLTAIMF